MLIKISSLAQINLNMEGLHSKTSCGEPCVTDLTNVGLCIKYTTLQCKLDNFFIDTSFIPHRYSVLYLSRFDLRLLGCQNFGFSLSLCGTYPGLTSDSLAAGTLVFVLVSVFLSSVSSSSSFFTSSFLADLLLTVCKNVSFIFFPLCRFLGLYVDLKFSMLMYISWTVMFSEWFWFNWRNLLQES